MLKSTLFVLFWFAVFAQSFAQGKRSAVELSIAPVFGKAPLVAEKWFVSANGDSLQFDNIRFYLSNIRFELRDGQIVNDSVNAHLIDGFEPSTLRITFPLATKHEAARIKKIHFDLGIDSTTNVSGAQGGDLDPSKGMYWAWQSGYINLKIEGISPQSKNRKQAFQFHLGGYQAPYAALRKVSLPLDQSFGEKLLLQMDLAAFFQNIQMATQVNTMSPGSAAMKLADYTPKMFTIDAQQK
ncbi:MbnP family protein [Haliscomenobacter hydrossis]|uniref:Copper-binding protein MbnP-like domain-containing protein n=1 Tax=Haliscomenobacter hydrossis (strain ATCC 27775 / DSM 1100 / LMG 10767 / O) TaxID=760192 RepID=F4L7B5_HALH1|nr:MbnP family protein [Haliscomenobacter hydrossis]AEE53142.1 hypothetical protein Halhy_5317 [Haliscomenobacter hydrossis DSM 1100]